MTNIDLSKMAAVEVKDAVTMIDMMRRVFATIHGMTPEQRRVITRVVQEANAVGEALGSPAKGAQELLGYLRGLDV